MDVLFEAFVAVQVNAHDQRLNEKAESVESVVGSLGKGHTVIDEYFHYGRQEECAEHANVVSVLVLEHKTLGLVIVQARIDLDKRVNAQEDKFDEALDGKCAQLFARTTKAWHVDRRAVPVLFVDQSSSVSKRGDKAPPQR